MSKTIYFLVILAVIAQAYGSDVEDAASAVEAPVKSAEDAVQSAGEGAAPPSSIPSSAPSGVPNPASYVDPVFNAAKQAVNQGQKAWDGIFRIPGQ